MVRILRESKGLQILDAVVRSCETTTIGRQNCILEERESQHGEEPEIG